MMMTRERETNRSIGSQIKHYRLLSGVSQKDLANKLKLSYQQLHKYEKGQDRISASKLLTIAEILGVGISYFYKKKASRKGASDKEVSAKDMRILHDYISIKDINIKKVLSEVIKVVSKG